MNKGRFPQFKPPPAEWEHAGLLDPVLRAEVGDTTKVKAATPVAADATCARLMGFEPGRIVHIREGSRFLGNAAPGSIEQVGEPMVPPITPFHVVPEFLNLYAI